MARTGDSNRSTLPRLTGRFDHDARAYLELPQVRAMPTYVQRALHIHEWIAVFGAQRRSSLTAAEITAQLHRWRVEPRILTKRAKNGTPPVRYVIVLSAAAVNKRRTALMHLWTALDGPSAPNPVKDTPKCAVSPTTPPVIPWATLAYLFNSLPETRTTARLMVLAYTGITPAQLRAVRPSDVDHEAQILTVLGRRPAHHQVRSLVPLLPEALAAFQRMAETHAWGDFTAAPLQRALHRAGMAVLGVHLRPTDLLHAYRAELARRHRARRRR